MLDQENDDWPLLSAIHGTIQDLPTQISKSLKNIIESSRQAGVCEDDVPWPCFNYEAASELLFFQSQGNKKTTYVMTDDDDDQQSLSMESSWDMSKFWMWALSPELLFTWFCLAVFLLIVGCCWICKQLSDGLCKIAVILFLTTALVSVVLVSQY